MNNSNSFNVCSRCGSANSLSAKYCYQCGSQLKVPDEPVACPKCHSINSSMANFCRTCGETLKTATKTKICPRCKRQLGVDQTQCACGYMFTAIDQKQKTASKQKGGRLVAILSLVFTLIFALALTIPFNFMQDFAEISNLYTIAHGVSYEEAWGIATMVAAGINLINDFAIYIQQGYLSVVMLLALVFVTLLTMVVQLLCAIIRLIHGRRGKHSNVFYAIMFAITGINIGMFLVANIGWAAQMPSFLQQLFAYYQMPEWHYVGWGMFIIPAYYLFFFIFSLFAKRKKV